MIKNFKFINIFNLFFLFLILFSPVNLLSQEAYCLNNKFLIVPNNSIHCYVKVSKKTQDEVSAISDFVEREKKYFDSEEYNEHLNQQKKFEQESLELKKFKDQEKKEDYWLVKKSEMDSKRRQDCEKRNNESIDINSSSRQVCFSNPNEKDKNICMRKFPPNYKEKKYTSRAENCY